MHSGAAKRILVADDEEDILILLQRALEAGTGYQVLLAQDGYKALRIARSELPDLVILDAIMPGLTGFEICRILKADPRTSHIKVIFLTGLKEEGDRGLAGTAGADGYLTKPFQLGDIAEEVTRVLYM